MTGKYDLKKAIGRILYNKTVHTVSEKYRKKIYITGINRVIDYIELHLNEELKLEDLSRIANFSKFHFHRIFKAITGESLHHYIQRLRIEKAASELFVDPDLKITSIAYDYGFGSSSSFGRIFKKYFSVSPGVWQKSASKEIFSEKDKKNTAGYLTLKPINIIKRISLPGKKIKLKDVSINIIDIPEIIVAYLRHTGPDVYNSEPLKKLYSRLNSWAETIPVRITDKSAIIIYHDHFGITKDSRLRTSICIKIPADIKVAGEIGKMTIPGGRYVSVQFELSPDESLDVTQVVYKDWLPASGYHADKKRLLFSIFRNYLDTEKDQVSRGEFYIPIKSS